MTAPKHFLVQSTSRRPNEILGDIDLFREAAVVGGRWIEAAGFSEVGEIFDPSSNALVGKTPSLSVAEIEQAIEAADRAFTSWRRTTASDRARIVRRWGELMIECIDDLAALMTLEQGKPIADAKGEIRYAAGFVEWFAEECKRTYGETIPSPWPDKRLIVTKEPIGVVAAITPWNFPSAMVTRKAVPAIAAGCTVVLKPAEQTPFSALALAVLAERAGLPPGVLNVVTGDAPRIGRVLCESPIVRKLTFTGSTEVGRLLMAQCAPTVKKLGLELGGNAPFIVLDDANIDAAVEGAIASKYRNAGQTCVCTNRFLVQAAVYDDFLERLATRSAALKVGDGFSPEVTQGPIIDELSIEKIERLLADATAAGAQIVTGGKRIKEGTLFFQPTVLGEVTPSMRVAREEIFGPVAPVIRFETDDEAVSLANSTEYGLAAYLYGTNMNRIWAVMERLDFGIIGVNSGVVSTEVAPFGGVKQSGVGREGGKQGLEDFLELKYCCLGGMVS